MSYAVNSLEPKALWKYFQKISQIPHGSGNESSLGDAILSWAEEKGCETDRDDRGNVVVRIPATKGCENTPTVVLQGHIDMVCEKNTDTAFDFEKDSLVLKRDGDWLKADGTTLGADNGIGVATGLAFMDKTDTVHGPLEILCTVEEETGLYGARALQPDFLKGRMLFNLDSEEDGVFYVGCAGGKDSVMELPIEWEPVSPGRSAFEVSIKGLRGGHSGMNIIDNRGNAIKLVARAIRAALKELDLSLCSITGGDKHNAIAREASAAIAIAPADKDKLKKILDAQLEGFKEEFAKAEPELSLEMVSIDTPKKAMKTNSRDAVQSLALGIPHGVLAMVRDMPGMVETSSNMARFRTEDDKVTVLCSSRSAVASALDGVVAQIEAIGYSAGAKVVIGEGYPGWMPNMESKMLAKAKITWKELFGNDAEFQVIHAGLECGIIGEKYSGMDMISLGPTIQNPHSPDERVSIPTVERFFKFVVSFLEELTKE